MSFFFRGNSNGECVIGKAQKDLKFSLVYDGIDNKIPVHFVFLCIVIKTNHKLNVNVSVCVEYVCCLSANEPISKSVFRFLSCSLLHHLKMAQNIFFVV